MNIATQNLPRRGSGADFEMETLLGEKYAIGGSSVLLP